MDPTLILNVKPEKIAGRIEQEIPEKAVSGSTFYQHQQQLPAVLYFSSTERSAPRELLDQSD